MKHRLILSVLILMGMAVFAQVQAQTPALSTPTNLNLTWLASLKMNPTTVVAGTTVTGTVTLMRPAISEMTIGLGLSGANPVEGNILAADGAVMTSQVKVPAGSSQATFVVTTTKPTSTIGSKTFTVTAAYGTERVSASFTTTPPLLKPRL